MSKRRMITKKQNREFQKAFKKPEFWIGLITVVVLIGVVLFAGMNQLKKMVATKITEEQIVSPVPLTKTKTQSLPTPSVALSNQIKKLADTSGVITTITLANDNFWNISVRMCGTGAYYKTIQSMNGYEQKSLQRGDIITIYCL